MTLHVNLSRFRFKRVKDALNVKRVVIIKMAVLNLIRDWRNNTVVEFSWNRQMPIESDIYFGDDVEEKIERISKESNQSQDIVINYAISHFLNTLFKKKLVEEYAYLNKQVLIRAYRKKTVPRMDIRLNESQMKYCYMPSIKEALNKQ